MNIFSYSIKRSDREELEHNLNKRLTDAEYNSIVNSVSSLGENLQKIDLASILSPTDTEVQQDAPKKISAVEKENSDRSRTSSFSGEMENLRSSFLEKIENIRSSRERENPTSSREVDYTRRERENPTSRSETNQPITKRSNLFSKKSRDDSSDSEDEFTRGVKKSSENQKSNFLSRFSSSRKKYISENQNWEEKYLKYKNKYLTLKQKIGN